jgi:hypothetical protein
MEKYIIIIIVLVLVYYLHRYCVQTEVEKFINIKENFGNAVTVDAVDDNNAINILAKIAKDLQEGGGLKVKGKIDVAGGGRFTNPSGPDSGGYEFLHDNLTQGIGLGYNTVYAAGTSPDVPLSLKSKGKAAIGLNAPDTYVSGNLNVGGGFNLLPRGVIVAWNGAPNAVPAGWFLCDGGNGTPDLRNRFVVGSGGQYATGNTGGADTVTLTVAQIPPHTHDYAHATGARGMYGGSYWGPGGAQTGSTGGGQAHENRPPYYALAWIMKA